MVQPAVNSLLRFCCPICFARLVVDSAIAGTSGPCPSCGAEITAPPIDAARSLIAKQAAPVVIKPRGTVSASTAPAAAPTPTPTPTPTAQGYMDSDPQEVATRSEALAESIRTERSVRPDLIVSQKNEDKKNAMVFFKILLAVAGVATIVLLAYYVVKRA